VLPRKAEPAEAAIVLIHNLEITMADPLANSGIRDNYNRGLVADFLKSHIKDGSHLSVVSAFFTIYAYAALLVPLNKETTCLMQKTIHTKGKINSIEWRRKLMGKPQGCSESVG